MGGAITAWGHVLVFADVRGVSRIGHFVTTVTIAAGYGTQYEPARIYVCIFRADMRWYRAGDDFKYAASVCVDQYVVFRKDLAAGDQRALSTVSIWVISVATVDGLSMYGRGRIRGSSRSEGGDALVPYQAK